MLNVTNSPDIYIIGEAGSGKNFIVNILNELYPSYQVVSIGKPLYDLAKYLKADDKNGFMLTLKQLGFDMFTSQLIWGDIPNHIVKEVKNPAILKPRKALQVLGDILRHYNINSLINYTINRSLDTPTIIDDVRLIREGEYLSKAGFKGVRVYSDKEVRVKRLKMRDKTVDLNRLKHQTETEVDKIPYDFFIDNTIGAKEELVEKIKEIIRLSRKEVNVCL